MLALNKYFSFSVFFTVFSAQAMDFSPIEGIGYTIQDRSSNRFLDADEQAWRAEVTVQAAKPKDLKQQWVWHRAEEEHYLLQNRATAKFLHHIPTVSTYAGPIENCRFRLRECSGALTFSIHSAGEAGGYIVKSRGDFLGFDDLPWHHHHAVRRTPCPLFSNNWLPNNSSPRYQWLIKPTGYTLQAEISNFIYGETQVDLQKFSKTDCTEVLWEMTNKADYPYTEHPHIAWSKETTQAWSFKKSCDTKFFNKLEVKVSASWLKSLAKGISNKTEWTVRQETLEKTEKREVTSNSFQSTADIEIPPQTKAFYEVRYRVLEGEVPFTAQVKVFGNADRMKMDGTLEERASLLADEIKTLMKQDGYQGTLTGQEEYAVFSTIEGTLKVAGATNIQTQLRMQSLR